MVAVLIPSTLLMSIAAKLKQQAQLSTNSFRLRGFLLAVHKQEGCQKDIPAISPAATKGPAPSLRLASL